jgi:hypothetical protein
MAQKRSFARGAALVKVGPFHDIHVQRSMRPGPDKKGGSRTFAASANTTLPDQGSGRSAGSRSRTPVHLQEGRRAAVRCDRDECPVRGNLLSAIVDKVFAWQYGRISQIMGQRNGQPPSAVTSSDRASLAAQGA